MKILDIDTKVVSGRGDIITFEEHCQRLATYIEEIKEKALPLTQSNPELTEYIRSLKLFRPPMLYIEDNTCFYCVSVGIPHILEQEAAVNDGTIGLWFTSTGLDENGHPKLYHDYIYIRDKFREQLVANFIMPRLANNIEFFVTFLKDVILMQNLMPSRMLCKGKSESKQA